MKSFFRDYGGIIFIAVIIIAIIGITVISKNTDTKVVKTKDTSTQKDSADTEDAKIEQEIDQCADLPTYTYNGRTVQVDYSTAKGYQSWQQAQNGITNLNSSNYKGRSDWRLFESEEEVRAWWDTMGSIDFSSGKLGSVVSLWSSIKDGDLAYYWDCYSVQWNSKYPVDSYSDDGWFAVRG